MDAQINMSRGNSSICKLLIHPFLLFCRPAKFNLLVANFLLHWENPLMNCAGDVSSTTNQRWIRAPDPGDKVSLYSSPQVLSFFLFFPSLFFLLCSTQDRRWRVKMVKSSTFLVERGPDFRWVGSQWHNSGATWCLICTPYCLSREC